MNINEMQGEILKLLKLPKYVTRVELTLHFGAIPIALVTFYPEAGFGDTVTKRFECYGTHSTEIE